MRNDKKVDPYKIATTICRKSGITEFQFQSRARKREVITARQIFMLIMQREYNCSLKVIGEYLNNNHTNVSDGISSLLDKLATVEPIRELYWKCCDSLGISKVEVKILA